MSLNTVNPMPGRWTLIVDFNQPVVGNEISEPYSGHIRFSSGVGVSTGGLPDNASTTLAPGSMHTYRVKIHNAGRGAGGLLPRPEARRLGDGVAAPDLPQPDHRCRSRHRLPAGMAGPDRVQQRHHHGVGRDARR